MAEIPAISRKLPKVLEWWGFFTERHSLSQAFASSVQAIWLNPRSCARSRASPAVDDGRGCGWKRWSRPVSRVLYVLRRDSHSSRPGVAAWLQQPTREQRGPRYRPPIWSCSEWGLPCRTTLTPYAVRSYRTLSPLPDPLAGPSAVCSLLHWPSAHAAQELPGTLPCGARTFLDALACDATVRPTPPGSIEE